jgi:hypothetical protein
MLGIAQETSDALEAQFDASPRGRAVVAEPSRLNPTEA